MMSRQDKKVALDLMAKLERSWETSNSFSKVKLISDIKEDKGREFIDGLTYK